MNINIVDDPELLLNTKEGFLSALGFWEWKKLNNKASDDFKSTLDIINDINSGLPTKDKRIRCEYFKEIYEILKN